jgi:hypothetical protein
MNPRKTFLFTAALIGLTSKWGWACSVCFSSVKTDPIVISLKWAILSLLGTVGVVIFYFVKFLYKLISEEEKFIKNI